MYQKKRMLKKITFFLKKNTDIDINIRVVAGMTSLTIYLAYQARRQICAVLSFSLSTLCHEIGFSLLNVLAGIAYSPGIIS